MKGGRYYNESPSLLATPVSANAEGRRAELTERLVGLSTQLGQWQELQGRWGHVNELIKAVNQTYDQLGISERVPEGLY